MTAPGHQRAMTLRIDEDDAQTLEAIASAAGTSVSAEVRAAILDRIEARGRDAEFMAALRDVTKRSNGILDRLSRT